MMSDQSCKRARQESKKSLGRWERSRGRNFKKVKGGARG